MNKHVKELLNSLSITHLATYNETKAGFVERLIKTIKQKITKYLMYHQTNKWIDILSDVTSAYNSAQHRMLGAAPMHVTPDNQDESRVRQYLLRYGKSSIPQFAHTKPPKVQIKSEPFNFTGKKQVLDMPANRRDKKLKFKIGQLVRVSRLPRAFGREYDEKFSHELFKISKGYFRDDLEVYQLADLKDEPISGTWYRWEISLAAEPEKNMYVVNAIEGERMVNRRKQYLVSFIGWPKKFNEYIDAKNVKDIHITKYKKKIKNPKDPIP